MTKKDKLETGEDMLPGMKYKWCRECDKYFSMDTTQCYCGKIAEEIEMLDIDKAAEEYWDSPEGKEKMKELYEEQEGLEKPIMDWSSPEGQAILKKAYEESLKETEEK